MSANNTNLEYTRCKAKDCWCSVDAPSQNGAVTVLPSPFPINAANMSVKPNSDQIAIKLSYLQARKSLMLSSLALYSIVHSQSTAIKNCFLNVLNIVVVFQTNWDAVLWQSQAQYHSGSVCFHTIEIYISCKKNHCACYSSVYQLIFTTHCSPFTHKISLNESLDQARYSSWWNILLHSVMVIFHSVIPPHFLVLTVTNTFAANHFDFCIGQINLGTYGAALLLHCSVLSGRSMPMSCFISDPSPLHNSFHYQLNHPSCNSSVANCQCPHCFQVWYANHIWLDDSLFFRFCGHLISEFIFLGGPLQTKLVVKVIYMTTYMQPRHHVERVTRMLRQSLPCPKCLPGLSSAWFKHIILSV